MTRLRGERGAGTIEYVGAIVAAALVVVLVLVSPLGGDLGGTLKTAACKVKSAAFGGSCDSSNPTAAPRTDKDFEPAKCKTNETGDKFSSKIKIFFVEIGNDTGFVVTQYSDGTVTMTATDGGSIGATGGVGADVSLGKLEAGAKVDFGAGFKVGYGSTWKFKNMDEAKAMQKQLNEYLAQQYMITHDSSGGAAIAMLIDEKKPPKAPSQSTSVVEVTGDVTGTLGIDLNASSGSKEAGTNQKAATTLQGVVAKVGGSAKWTVMNDSDTGTTTYTTGLELTGDTTAQAGLATFGGNGLLGSSMSITRDKSGKITNVTFVSTSEGGTTNGAKSNAKGEQGSTSGGAKAGSSSKGTDATVTTTSLDVSSDADQKMVQDWLGGDGNFSAPGAITGNLLDPTKKVAGDDFQNLLNSQAKVSQIAYNNISDTTSFGLNVKLGVALGFDFSLAHNESNAIDAEYLGAPGPDGARAPVDFTDCVK